MIEPPFDFLQQAYHQLRPETPNWYYFAKEDADGNTIPNDQRMCYEHTMVRIEGVTKPTKAEVDAKVAELQAQWDADNAPYKLDRARAYPSIADQLDQIYHEGIDAWKETVAAVKAEYPKP
jgi:hypothetical protein